MGLWKPRAQNGVRKPNGCGKFQLLLIPLAVASRVEDEAPESNAVVRRVRVGRHTARQDRIEGGRHLAEQNGVEEID